MGKKLDLLGQTFGKLKVIEKVFSEVGQSRWKCVCECGKEIIAVGGYLTSGNTRSCGCSRKESQLADLTGKRIGKIKVLNFDKAIKRSNQNDRNYWLCECDCGIIKSISHKVLKKNNPEQNCGCENIKKLIARSTNPNAGFNRVYRNYTRRSSHYNMEFLLTVEEFYNLTQGNCYYCGEKPSRTSKAWSDKISPFIYNGIDRIDSNIGYVLNNCISCCTKCNYAKSIMSQNDFKDWIIKVYNNFIK